MILLKYCAYLYSKHTRMLFRQNAGYFYVTAVRAKNITGLQMLVRIWRLQFVPREKFYKHRNRRFVCFLKALYGLRK